MYRQIHLHFSPAAVTFAGHDCLHRVHHPGKASQYRLARVLHKLDNQGLLEVQGPSLYFLGVYYRVWDV